MMDCPLIRTGESGQIIDSTSLSAYHFGDKTKWKAEKIITQDEIRFFSTLE